MAIVLQQEDTIECGDKTPCPEKLALGSENEALLPNTYKQGVGRPTPPRKSLLEP